MEARQCRSDDILSLSPDDTVALQIANPSMDHIQLRAADWEWNWSGDISIEKEVEVTIRITNRRNNIVFFVAVVVKKRGPRVIVDVVEVDGKSPFVVENYTAQSIDLCQEGERMFTTLPPLHTCGYAWDSPFGTHRLSVVLRQATDRDDDEDDGVEGDLFLGAFAFRVGEHVAAAAAGDAFVNVLERGPVRVLQIFNVANKPPPAKPLDLGEPRDKNEAQIRVVTSFANVGVSIVDQTPQEIVFIAVMNSHAEYTLCKNGDEKIGFSLGSFHIDNQLWETPFPSIVHPLRLLGAEGNDFMGGDGDKPFLAVVVSRDASHGQGPNVLCLSKVDVALSPVDVNVEGTVLVRLLHMLTRVSSVFEDTFLPDGEDSQSSSSKKSTRACTGKACTERKVKEIVRHLADSRGMPLKAFAKDVHISAIYCNLSFNPAVAEKAAIATSSRAFDIMNRILLTFGSTFVKIDNCQLHFREYSLIEGGYVSVEALGGKVVNHYSPQALAQLAVVLGSFEVLGHPMELLQVLGEGIKDFLYLPTKGLITSPQAFVGGIVCGTSSLVCCTVASVCTTVSHVSSSLQNGLAASGLLDPPPHAVTDKNKSVGTAVSSIALRSAQNKVRPANAFVGLKQGVEDLLVEISNGRQRDGFRGAVVRGARGCIGLVAKTLFGALRSSSSLLDAVSFRLHPRMRGSSRDVGVRVRPPRFLPFPDSPLQVYSAEINLGQELLSRVASGKHKFDDYRSVQCESYLCLRFNLCAQFE